MTIYTAVYYLIVFNKYFEGINGQTLRNNTFIKQILLGVMLIAIIVSMIIIFNMQNMVIGGFLTLDDKERTVLIGAGAVDTIKLWGYRVLAVIIILSVYIAIRSFKKNNTKKIIKSLAVVPIYLVCLFVVLCGYNLIFIRGSELEKQKTYIGENINATKIAYDIKLDEKQLTSTGTITEEEARENQKIINNIPVVTEDVVRNNLLQTQTRAGYYTYNKVKASLYNDELTYIAAREMNSEMQEEQYTHGYGAAITSATETDEGGNVKYIELGFENEKIKEPRIYYGVENTRTIAISGNLEEFDYPKTNTNNETTNYYGDGGIKLGFIDRICVGIREGNLSVILSDSDSKVMLNRNIIDRAKEIMPYLMYDESPYLVISDVGEAYWILDAYTISNECPYSQKTKLAYKNETKEINYIRNSVKVIINAFDGETKFYITDKTDPVAMVYNNMYKSLFTDGNEIPEGISKYFTYSELLYNIQSKVITRYHDISADILYRGNDIWEIASYSNLITRTAKEEMKPSYVTVKSENGENKLGLVNAYNQYGKESLNAYLVGTVENGKNQLSLYKFSGDMAVVGPMQLDSLIEQDETISSEISNLNVTGTKITKEMVMVPIENTMLYVVPIYQTSLNEVSSVPILKKVVVASGNKIALGDNLSIAIKNLLSPTGSLSIDVEDNSTIEGLVSLVIKANNNLIESNNSNNWEQMGKDIEALQKLIKQLEEAKNNEDKKTQTGENNQVNTVSEE